MRTDLNNLVAESLGDLCSAIRSAGVEIREADFEIDVRPAPHRPPSNLPYGRMAVYAFFHGPSCLKVGKVGAASGPRYTSHHYHSSAPSTLAKSLTKQPGAVGLTVMDAVGVGTWIKQNACRANLLLPASFGLPVISLVEAYLHVRWKPAFEGRG